MENYRTPEQPRLTEAQEESLRWICERYHVAYDPAHYVVHPPDAVMMPGYCEGWVGGWEIQQEKPTIYIGVSPEGERHS